MVLHNQCPIGQEQLHNFNKTRLSNNHVQLLWAIATKVISKLINELLYFDLQTFEIVHNLQGKQKDMVWRAILVRSNKM
jgi:hypothetical protein